MVATATRAIALTIAAPAVLALMSAVAAYRLPATPRWPMQFGLDGRPTWYAPRLAALSMTPALCLCVLLLLLATRSWLVPRGFLTMSFVAIVFAAAHLVYLALVARRA